MSGIPVQIRDKADVDSLITPFDVISSNAFDSAQHIVAKIDSFLVFSVSSQDYSFIVYNENTTCIELKFPKIGRGPDEQIFSKITQIRNNKGVLEVDILGLNEHNILTIDFYKSIEKRQMEIIKETIVPPNTIYTHLYENTRSAIVLYDEYDYTLQFFSEENMERENLILPFGLDFGDPGIISGTCIMKEDGTKCLWAMQWLDKFNILDIQNTENSHSFSTSRKNISDRKQYAAISEMSPSSVTIYYSAVQVTKNDIYLLYEGFSDAESSGKPREIQHFSWDGDFKHKYRISEEITSFIVSEDSSMIYGYSWDESKVY